jgi:16S rRNA (uracil1498-N3)-methyltransferase
MLAGRLRVPSVEGPSTFDEVLAAAEHPVLLVRSSPVDLADLTEPRDLTLLVGPEGGWSDRELALATSRAGLGPRNLRADTAAVVGLAVALAGRRGP